MIKISALQTGVPILGGSFILAQNQKLDPIGKVSKLDATDSAEFDDGVWNFYIVSFEGPTVASGKRYCGKLLNVTINSSSSELSLNSNEANCLVSPFISLVTTLITEYNPNSFYITNLTPNVGALAGGTVTINGGGFFSGATVSTAGGACTSVSFVNANSLTCTMPVHTAGSVSVTVTNPDSMTASLSSAYTYQLPPSATSILATNGPAAGGTTVTISGTDFSSVVTVTIGGNTCSVPVVTGTTSIQCTTPTHAQGVTDVVVTNSDNQTSTITNGYTFNLAPTVSSVLPIAGPLTGGTPITITGTNFLAGATVLVGGNACLTVNVASSTSITCTTDAHTSALVNIVVTNPDSQNATLANSFTFATPPSVTLLGPLTGDMAGGTLVTVTGSGFVSGATVTIGGVNCESVSFIDSTSLTCTNGAHAVGAVSAVVTNPDTQSGTLNSAFTYQNLLPPDSSSMALNDGASEWSNTATPIFIWSAAAVTRNSIDHYEIALGTASGLSDVTTWSNVGNVSTYQFTGLTLTRGQTYYASIRAVDTIGNISTANLGNGWVVINEFYIPNKPVKTSLVNGDTLYLGGEFTSFAERTGSGVPLSATTGAQAWTTKARVYGTVYASVSDGSSGYYIGGKFNAVGTYTRNNLAHILSDGSVDPTWNPNADGEVRAITISGANVYIGGQFNNIGGAAHVNLAAVNNTNGNALAWTANTDNMVLTLAADATQLYVGGKFTILKSTARSYSGAVLLSSGALTTWIPTTDFWVNSIITVGPSVYLGGFFTNFAIQVNNTNGAINGSWTPNVNGSVNVIVSDGTNIYLGGLFTDVNGSPRSNIAAVNTTNGNVLAWNPNADLTVYTMAISGSTLYVGGIFTNIGGQNRNNIAALSTSTGLATTWNPSADRAVFTLYADASTVYTGGVFNSIAGVNITRERLAAIDLKTGLLTAWNPSISDSSGSVRSLTILGSNIYVAGTFSTGSRNNLAAFDINTGVLQAWNPNPNFQVSSIINDGTNIYVGGDFTTIAGTGHAYLAALDSISGNDLGWNPTPDGIIINIIQSGNTIYAGGGFTNIGGQVRNHIAAIDKTTGLATAWDPNADGWVITLTLSGSTMYVGGSFFNIGAQARSFLAAIDTTTGLATAWDPAPDNTVNNILINGTTIYLGGFFNNIQSNLRFNFAAVDKTSGSLLPLDLKANNYVLTFALYNSSLITGGAFDTIGTTGPSFLAPLELSTGIWRPGNN